MTVAGTASKRTAADGGISESSAEAATRSAAIAEPSFTGLYPPRPRLTLNVGITGHRATVLPEGVADLLGPVVDDVFRNLRDAALRLHSAEAALFDSALPHLRLHTPLATGADQVAADGARASGYTIRALLPFAPDEYAKDFKGHELDEFRNQLDKAAAIFALPGDRSDNEFAYVMVGKAVVAAADISLPSGTGARATALAVRPTS